MTQIVSPASVQWYRIDKQDGSITRVLPDVVRLGAANYYALGGTHAKAMGRFSTPFAIYSVSDLLTVDERAQAEPAVA